MTSFIAAAAATHTCAHVHLFFTNIGKMHHLNHISSTISTVILNAGSTALDYMSRGVSIKTDFLLIYILKLEATVCVCHGSQRALTLYTQQPTALLRPIYPVSAVVGS